MGQHRHQFEHAVVAPPDPHPTVEQRVILASRIIGGERPAHAPADPGQLPTGRVERDLQPHLVVIGRGHPGDRPHLVEGEAALGEGGTERGQPLERVPDPDHLPSGPDVDPDVDRQPLRARAHSRVSPGAVRVQLRAESDDLSGGRVDARRQPAEPQLKLYTHAILHPQTIPTTRSPRNRHPHMSPTVQTSSLPAHDSGSSRRLLRPWRVRVRGWHPRRGTSSERDRDHRVRSWHDHRGADRGVVLRLPSARGNWAARIPVAVPGAHRRGVASRLHSRPGDRADRAQHPWRGEVSGRQVMRRRARTPRAPRTTPASPAARTGPAAA